MSRRSHPVNPPGYGVPVPRYRDGTPPTAEYLAARHALGFPSRSLELSRGCPWCRAQPYDQCQIRATGRKLTRCHHARDVPAIGGLAEPPAAANR